jgi:sugar phosphate isomerase/epimerase
MIIGKIRGNLLASDPATAWRWLREGVVEICGYAQRLGVQVVIEPQARSSLNSLNTTAEALNWIQSLEIANLGIMLDTCHMHAEGEDIGASIETAHAQGRLWHIHFAAADRSAPSKIGPIDFAAAVRKLRSTGYDRAITVEIAQIPDTLTVARAAAAFLRPLMGEG